MYLCRAGQYTNFKDSAVFFVWYHGAANYHSIWLTQMKHVSSDKCTTQTVPRVRYEFITKERKCLTLSIPYINVLLTIFYILCKEHSDLLIKIMFNTFYVIFQHIGLPLQHWYKLVFHRYRKIPTNQILISSSKFYRYRYR